MTDTVYVMYYWDQYATDSHSHSDVHVYDTMAQAKQIPEKKMGHDDWRETIGPWMIRLGNYWIETVTINHAKRGKT